MQKIIMYTSGVVEGDWAGVCVRILSAEGDLICQHSLRLPAATGEEAEYNSILLGVRIVNTLVDQGLLRADELIVYNSNKKITQQISRNSCCENAELAALLKSVDIELDKLPHFEIHFIHKSKNAISNTIATNAAVKNICVREHHPQKKKPHIIADHFLRISWDEYFMEIARLTAQRSSCVRPGRNVGAVLVKDKRIIATGYNGAAQGLKTCKERGECMREREQVPSGTRMEFCYAVHAEANAILQCAKMGTSSDDTSIYVTHFPCSLCTKMLIQAGVKKVVFAQGYPDSFSEELLKEANISFEQMQGRSQNGTGCSK